MFGRTFYNSSLRKYIITFGNMFNGIYVQRLDSSGNRIQNIKVPIAYGPKQKFLVRLGQDPNLDQDVALSLPRIGFEVVGMNYAANRKLPSTIKHSKVDRADLSKLTTQYVPVPYDIQIILSIFVKNADDGAQIIEQIVPYFQPEWTNSINLIPEMNLTYDVPCVLNDISIEDSYEGDFDTRRALIYNLTFTMKGYFFGPISTTGTIKRITLNSFSDIVATDSLQSVTVQPGLKSDGTPTSNTALSIPPSEIEATDDYGFTKSISE